MFGKKKKSDDDVAPEAAAKPSKPEKAKKKAKKAKDDSTNVRVTASRGPNIVVRHIEKVVLAGIIGLVGFLVFRSFSAETLQSSQTPESLANQSDSILNQVKNESHWDAIYPEREKYVRHKFHADTLIARESADANQYPFGRLEPPAIRESTEQRGDPEIAPVEQLQVTNVTGALGIWVQVKDGNSDPFLALEDAKPIGKKTRPERTRGPGGRNPDPNAPGGPDGGTNDKVHRQLNSKYDLGFHAGGEGAGGLRGSGPGLGGINEKSQMDEYGGVPLGSVQPANQGPNQTDSGLVTDQSIRYRLGSRPVVFNAITALIPHRKNEQAYFDAFSRTGTFLAGRDRPAYLGIEVQRVNVTGDAYRDISEEEWKTVLTTKDISEMPRQQQWATHLPQLPITHIPDVINSRYDGLTAPIVPMLVRDYREFSKHSKIEWLWNTTIPQLPTASNRKPPSGESGGGDSDPLFGQNGANSGIQAGGSSRPSGGPPGVPGAGGKGGGLMGGGKGGGMLGGGGDSGGNRGEFGMLGPAGQLTEETLTLEPEFKMVRVYDFLKWDDIGKEFRYRIRITMRDPNYPENQDYYDRPAPDVPISTHFPAPSNEELKQEVYERVASIRSKEDPVIADAIQKKTFKYRARRTTQWSAPSDPITVARPIEVFAGEIERTGGGTAKMVVAQLATNSRIPGAVMASVVSAQRGNVLGTPPANLDLIAPTTKEIKQIEKAPLATGAVLVDWRGGSRLSGYSKDDPMLSEGEAMVLRPDGTLVFSSDLDDQMLYRMYSFQDEIEKAADTKNSGDRDGAGPSGGTPGAGRGGAPPGLGGKGGGK